MIYFFIITYIIIMVILLPITTKKLILSILSGYQIDEGDYVIGTICSALILTLWPIVVPGYLLYKLNRRFVGDLEEIRKKEK